MARACQTSHANQTALVLFSGGQDSATCLAWALNRFARVELLGFSYGQRHLIELDCRDRLIAGMKALNRRLGDKTRRQPHAGHPDPQRDFRHRADP